MASQAKTFVIHIHLFHHPQGPTDQYSCILCLSHGKMTMDLYPKGCFVELYFCHRLHQVCGGSKDIYQNTTDPAEAPYLELPLNQIGREPCCHPYHTPRNFLGSPNRLQDSRHWFQIHPSLRAKFSYQDIIVLSRYRCQVQLIPFSFW